MQLSDVEQTFILFFMKVGFFYRLFFALAFSCCGALIAGYKCFILFSQESWNIAGGD